MRELRCDCRESKCRYKGDGVWEEEEEPDKWASIKPRQPQSFAVACSVKEEDLNEFLINSTPRQGKGSEGRLTG
jgi:hypothetical protein